MRVFCLILFNILTLSAFADSHAAIVGSITVVDGETLEIQNQRVKLWGVDAPDIDQTCHDGQGTAYNCGKEAASALSRWLGELQPVQCEPRGNDNIGNIIAICYTSTGDDIAGWMVRNGYAIDWPKYSNGFYAVPQNEAQQAKNGLWKLDVSEPWKIPEN